MPWWPDKYPEPRRSQIRNRIVELRTQKLSYGDIAKAINTEFGEDTECHAVGRAVKVLINEGRLEKYISVPKPPQAAENPDWFWSDEEKEILKTGWMAGDLVRTLCKKLPKRASASIERMRKVLNLPPRLPRSWYDSLDPHEKAAAERDKFIPYTMKQLSERFGVCYENIRKELKRRGIRWIFVQGKPISWLDKLSPADQQYINGSFSLLTPQQWAERLDMHPNTVYETFKTRGIDWVNKGVSSVPRPKKFKPPKIAKPRSPPPRRVKAPPPPTQSVEDWLKTHDITQCKPGYARGLGLEWEMIERVLDRAGL